MILPRMKDPNEKPLDTIVSDGGFCSIFRTMACIGDSLASGEFETREADGKGYYDKFEYSWGQYIARMTGSTVYNFSRGGMTAKEYWESFAEERGFWDPSLRAQAYVIALGVNDLLNRGGTCGTVADYLAGNEQTFAYYYGKIVERLKEIAPNAFFFFVTMPKKGACADEDQPETMRQHRALLDAFAAHFSQSYVIDLYTYAPVMDAEYRADFFLNSHLNALGYRLSAQMIASYIDYIIRQHPRDFDYVGFESTDGFIR